MYLFGFDPAIFYSFNLPTIPQIVSASPERTYLALKLTLDLGEISQMLLDSNLPAPILQKPIRGMVAGDVTLPLLNVFQRLVGLLDEPQDIPILASQFNREYKRTFGTPPKRDITKIRQMMSTGFASGTT